ncbi:MAG TPA: MotA/TolQ/ExbB proton channel family protein [Steroidobacteraceae bacterium]|nr:MotA/TolQ/ExbB proton channel family protein [Steroidobacteraceae bacterium]
MKLFTRSTALLFTALAPLPALAQAVPADATQAVANIANPYGLSALWGQGDLIARGTLVALGIMSASTWYILVTKVLEQHVLFRKAREAGQKFWKSGTVADGVKALSADSPFHAIAATGVGAFEHHEGSLVENIDLNTWITLSIQRAVEQIVNRLQGGLAVLATVGSTAPFVGLFGTVWGIYHALTAIGIAGQASIDKVAGPVGEALIMTALGLATAVPAVLGYNWLVRRNKVAVEKLRGFASDLHSVLVSGKIAGRQAAASAPRPEQQAGQRAAAQAA